MYEREDFSVSEASFAVECNSNAVRVIDGDEVGGVEMRNEENEDAWIFSTVSVKVTDNDC